MEGRLRWAASMTVRAWSLETSLFNISLMLRRMVSSFISSLGGDLLDVVAGGDAVENLCLFGGEVSQQVIELLVQSGDSLRTR